jgi:4'-phosphopantetheinyl transferase
MSGGTAINVFWLQQKEADVPAKDDWLCANEAFRLKGMRFPKRRGDWRLGRWTAKCAFAAYLGCSVEKQLLTEIEIRPAISGAPEVILAGRPAAASISLSHRAGTAMVVIGDPGVTLGCDLEMVEPRSAGFIADYFVPEEQALVASTYAADRPALLALLWSAKESALKALRQGLRLDTRSVLVNIPDNSHIPGGNVLTPAAQGGPARPQPASNSIQDGWRTLQIRCINADHILHGWWQHTGNFVRTVVADSPLLPPVLMNPRHDGGE